MMLSLHRRTLRDYAPFVLPDFLAMSSTQNRLYNPSIVFRITRFHWSISGQWCLRCFVDPSPKRIPRNSFFRMDIGRIFDK